MQQRCNSVLYTAETRQHQALINTTSATNILTASEEKAHASPFIIDCLYENFYLLL